MSHAAAARKRTRTTHTRKTVAIRLSAHGPAKSAAPLNWRHAMSTRTRVMFRRFFVMAAVSAPLLATRARAAEAPLRAVREVRVETAAQRDLSRLLDRVKRNKSLVEARARARTLSAEDAAQLRKDLASVERRARALSRKSRARLERGLRSLDMELDEIGQKIRT